MSYGVLGNLQCRSSVAKGSYRYRPDPKRGIFVTEELTDEFLGRLSVQILGLRAKSTKPITVFINSPGGDLRVLEVILGLLESKDQDGKSPRVITVAVGNADSAAATLLALGRYAIAYRHSTMHFHGSRFPVVRDLTAERASTTAANLLTYNRRTALNLAKRVMSRLVLKYIRLSAEAPDEFNDPDASTAIMFADALKRRVSVAGDRVIDKALSDLDRISKRYSDLSKFKSKPRASGADQDAQILRNLLANQVKEHKSHPDWRLDEDSLQELVQDYLLLRDYSFGPHTHYVSFAVASFGPAFLGTDDFKKWAELQKTDSSAATKFLTPVVYKQIREFWYFAVCLCRFMQAGENPLLAEDAYWLGIVDEVLGTDMAGERTVATNADGDEDDDAYDSESEAELEAEADAEG